MNKNPETTLCTTRHGFTQAEVDDALWAVEQAIESHRNWYQKLHEGLLCAQPFQEDITSPVAHTCCNFGRWYYQSAQVSFRATTEFKALEAAHKLMHDRARELVGEFQAGKNISLESYRTLAKSRQELIQLLVNLRDCIINQQHAFDPLTGLMNRKSIGLILDKIHLHSQRHQLPYAIAMLDIDRFKSINDDYGHAMGDQALRVVSDYLASSLRNSDSVSRYGGEEFLVLLPDACAESSFNLLNRIRQEISELCIEYDNHEINLTISIGFSCFTSDLTPPEIMEAADTALYHAKSNGRNQVVAFAPDMKGSFKNRREQTIKLD
ncbi:diguanylate cyclase [Halioxenophilus sp. WMMB6]|uniref:diguanylate cyclase n=1 Tax=Halioxenophilus sp. WMMB6 TaxID=3073815 RepID=UPI00295ED032|nr:diguanylate cyclase [Halioxenophilus sp. WMMB6]